MLSYFPAEPTAQPSAEPGATTRPAQALAVLALALALLLGLPAAHGGDQAHVVTQPGASSAR